MVILTKNFSLSDFGNKFEAQAVITKPLSFFCYSLNSKDPDR